MELQKHLKFYTGKLISLLLCWLECWSNRN